MYVYLYDNFLRQKKYESVVKSLEIRLTDYGIAGKILRLNNFIDVKPIIDAEVQKGASTVVIVGNDQTFGNVLSRSATCNVTFGFLPIGDSDNTIAEVLGIPAGIEACDVLSRRRLEKLDVGWMNNRYFVSQLHILPGKIQVEYDEKFRVSGTNLMELVVCNLQPFFWQAGKKDRHRLVVNPQDGRLEAFIRPVKKKRFWRYEYEEASVFPFEEMIVRSDEPFIVEADGKRSKEKKIKIKLAPHRINMVVGRERRF